MTIGFKTRGRQKGTPNEKTQEIQQLLKELRCAPSEDMARLAMDEKHSPELRGKMYSELAQYVAPKRKAIEHSTEGSSLANLLMSLGSCPTLNLTGEEQK